MTPRRVQRTRTKGGGMPPGAVYVGRPSKWGNPFMIRRDSRERAWIIEYADPDGSGGFATRGKETKAATAALAVMMYRECLVTCHLAVTVEDVRREIRGKDLACWCKPGAACHADVLLEVANAPEVKP